MYLSNKIKKLREKNNFTQEYVAEKLNVTRKTISSWENNRNVPNIYLLKRIANLYNISLNELITKSDNYTYNNYNKELFKKKSNNLVLLKFLSIINVILLLFCIINLLTGFCSVIFSLEIVILLLFYSIYVYEFGKFNFSTNLIWLILFISLIILLSLQIHKLQLLGYPITFSLILGSFFHSIILVLGINILFNMRQIWHQ